MKLLLYAYLVVSFISIYPSTDKLKCSAPNPQYYAQLTLAKDHIVKAHFKSYEDWLKSKNDLKANGFTGIIETPSGITFNLMQVQNILYSVDTAKK